LLALDTPAPEAPPALATRPPPAAAPQRASEGDFAAFVEARRLARGDSAPEAPPQSAAAAPPAAEDENARANRIAAANLGLGRSPTFGPQPESGGVFEVKRLGYDTADFMFYGWNKDIRRTTSQLIEVRKGNHSDIRLAVVRRMIAIIREHEDGDFTWDSARLGRKLTLSARARDNSGLEDFMIREFFGK
jgi:hypothetical protein